MKKNTIRIVTPPTASTSIEIDLVKITEYLIKKKKVDHISGLLGGEFGYGCNYKNEVFEIRPYYWGKCDCGWNEFYDEDAFKEKHKKDCYQSLVNKELVKNGWKKDKRGWIDHPQEMNWEKAVDVEDKIREKYCKKFNLSFPSGCAIHCTCGRDNGWENWYKKKVIEFKGKLGKLNEDGLPEAHKDTCSLILPNFIHKPTGFSISFYKWIGRDMECSKKISSKEWRKIFKEVMSSLKQ